MNQDLELTRHPEVGGWDGDAHREAPRAAKAPPGKATLTSRLPQRRGGAVAADSTALVTNAGPAVQRLASAAAGAEDPFAVHLLARQGVDGGGGALPHLDAIQRSFGHHDVSGVSAHVGGKAARAAAAIGARAYATGDEVAFAQAPDLRQTAHEAAHVVQQRGGVRLDGGVGKGGDPYEQHADAVAERVVRGESAQELLDERAHRGAAGGPAVQRLETDVDEADVEANVLSLTNHTAETTTEGGRRRRVTELDERSQRRLWERLCQLDPTIHAGDWDTMAEAERPAALRAAITRFQDSTRGAAMIREIEEANDTADPDGEGLMYEAPPEGERLASFAAHRAELHPGEVLANDITAQALANVWPQSIFGRMMDERQAYLALAAVVIARGLEFHPEGVNVIGVRAYQGGAIHDNDEEVIYTDRNRYNDTQFIVWKAEGAHHVRQARGTVDPGGPRARAAAAPAATAGDGASATATDGASADGATAPRRRDLTFAVAADQEWTYSGSPHGRSEKFDRAIYGMPDPLTVRRGRHWAEHPDEATAASARTHGGGRIIHRRDGRLETDRDAAGDARLVSAVHSGGSGGATGDRVFGDSTGCSVVHGDWFAHFNETVAGASGGDGTARFSYALIDPRMFAEGELEALLDPIAPRDGADAEADAGTDTSAEAGATP